jgi:hypothetical protein
MSTSTSVIALLLDLSGSMEQAVGHSGRTRRDILADAVKNVHARHPGAPVYAFGSTIERVYEPQQGLPPTMGGTDLTGALTHLRGLTPRVSQLVLISDGEPDDPPSALTQALLMSCKLSSVYCGDESNRKAIRFLRDFAACSRAGMLGVAKTVSLAAPDQATEEILRLVGPAGSDGSTK